MVAIIAGSSGPIAINSVFSVFISSPEHCEYLATVSLKRISESSEPSMIATKSSAKHSQDRGDVLPNNNGLGLLFICRSLMIIISMHKINM